MEWNEDGDAHKGPHLRIRIHPRPYRIGRTL